MSETEKKVPDARLREAQLSLPFDQYQRYRIVADVLEKSREDGRPLRVLDVGGAEGVILRFLPGDEVTVLDQAEVDGVPGFVRGDATAMPFDDDAFDFTVSLDTYEHIAPEDREAYLSELRRTARSGVLLGAPFDSEGVRDAEKAANAFHKSVLGSENIWLQEHAENGLPDLTAARDFFEERGDAVAALPNGYLPHWLAMICLTFHWIRPGTGLNDALEAVNTFYNGSIYRHDNTEPCYRYLLVCWKDATGHEGKSPPELDDLLSGDANSERLADDLALFGTLPVVLPLTSELGSMAKSLAGQERLTAEIERLNRRLAGQERKAERASGKLERKDAQIADLSRRIARLVGAENARQVKADQRLRDLQRANEDLKKQNAGFQRQLTDIMGSRTWRLLSAQRKLGSVLGRGRKRGSN